MSVANDCNLPKENNQSRQSVLCGKLFTSENSYLIDSIPVGDLHYLQDHRIAGNVIYPAAGFCMAGIAVHRSLRSLEDKYEPMVLENLKFRRSLALSDHNSVVLRLRYKPGRSEFTVHSDHDDDHSEVTPHAVGMLAGTRAEVPSCDSHFSNLLTSCSEIINVSDFYQRLSQSGLGYGPYFKRIVDARVSRQSDQALTRISCHPELTTTGDQQTRQITLLDCAFQSLAAALDPGHFSLYVPSRIRELRFFDDLEPNLWCYACLTNTTNRAVVGDITIYNVDKRPLMDIRGLSCLKIPPNQIASCDAALDCQGVSSHHNSNLHLQSFSTGLRN